MGESRFLRGGPEGKGVSEGMSVIEERGTRKENFEYVILYGWN